MRERAPADGGSFLPPGLEAKGLSDQRRSRAWAEPTQGRPAEAGPGAPRAQAHHGHLVAAEGLLLPDASEVVGGACWKGRYLPAAHRLALKDPQRTESAPEAERGDALPGVWDASPLPGAGPSRPPGHICCRDRKVTLSQPRSGSPSGWAPGPTPLPTLSLAEITASTPWLRGPPACPDLPGQWSPAADLAPPAAHLPWGLPAALSPWRLAPAPPAWPPGHPRDTACSRVLCRAHTVPGAQPGPTGSPQWGAPGPADSSPCPAASPCPPQPSWPLRRGRHDSPLHCCLGLTSPLLAGTGVSPLHNATPSQLASAPFSTGGMSCSSPFSGI